MFGKGGHGSRPETTIDPVVLAAATVMRLQAVVSREVAGTDAAVVTVGAIRAGTKENIVPDEAELLISVRTFEPSVRGSVLGAVERIIRAEAAASGATREPEITLTGSFPPVVNDVPACARTRPAFEELLGPDRVVDPGLVTGSEDVGLLASGSGAPCVFWLLGGADPDVFAGAASAGELAAIVAEQPSNHSPFYAPLIEPTLGVGVAALVVAAHTWLSA
jgi:hippurate hydrolase